MAPPCGQKAVWYLTEQRLQLGQSDDRGLDQNLAVVIVRALQTALQTLRGRGRTLSSDGTPVASAKGGASASYPVDAQQGAGLAEDADDLLDLAVGHPLADAAEHDQSSGLQGRVVLERKPGATDESTKENKKQEQQKQPRLIIQLPVQVSARQKE